MKTGCKYNSKKEECETLDACDKLNKKFLESDLVKLEEKCKKNEKKGKGCTWNAAETRCRVKEPVVPCDTVTSPDECSALEHCESCDNGKCKDAVNPTVEECKVFHEEFVGTDDEKKGACEDAGCFWKNDKSKCKDSRC